VVRLRVVVTGRVQGVVFRDSCRRQAERHGVAGWVRNADDGSVEAELEGDPDPVQAVLAWMHHGPEHAQVRDVAVSEVPETGEGGFRVR
jgi:acylphosphatase